MGNYTAEQVEAIARNVGFNANVGLAREASDVLRAYAATLRQQAGRVDFNESDLMALRSLKVGEVLTEEQWEAECQFVRHQDEIIRNLRAALAQNTQDAELSAMCDGSYVSPDDEAQNTDRDGEPVLLTLDSGFQIPIVRKGEGFVVDPRFPTISHAERARVPELEVPDSNGSLPHERAASYAYGWNACRKAMLAAAPSQRAEVKE